MEKNKIYRHEFKYRCSEEQLVLLENRLKTVLYPDPHAKNGEYTIRSMYFDNYADRCYYENENGVSPREKFRVRIYNGNDSRISLECKQKQGDKTFKTSCRLTRSDFDRISNLESPKDIGEKPPLLRRFALLQETQLFEPAVIVEYDRRPYIYKIGNVRITFDRHIRSSNAFSDFFSEVLPTRAIMPSGHHLLEVKYDELLPDYIAELMQIGDLQRTTFSKYYLCRKFSIGGFL